MVSKTIIIDPLQPIILLLIKIQW